MSQPRSLATHNSVDLSPAILAEWESHPAFPDLVRRAAAVSVELYRGHWMLNRLLNDRGRLIASLMILDLHFSAGSGQGFTAAQMRRHAIECGLCSPGRITAFLATLRLSGLLAHADGQNPGNRRLAPTEALLDVHRARWRRVFALLAELRPEARGASEALQDPAFVGHCAGVVMEAYRRGQRLYDFVPALTAIADRDAGLMVVLSLLTADPGQSVSVSDLARRFSVARSHVLETLRAAERSGLAVAASERGGYRAGPDLAPAMGRFFSVIFEVYLHAFVTARVRGWDVGG
ncbi:hypothetical protein [Aquabacter spiritensis]|uniref:Uncharacterized protein n=1 Tax=Aquabacter spiritensis TaxID=933073 RepID=A0A4R3LSX2_9HYPH|nr:hypothetical protein [Aquabacter spiritensis]TCT02639.1 hypothetical protein EDC64_11273 [Aquabacter spiritensis]